MAASMELCVEREVSPPVFSSALPDRGQRHLGREFCLTFQISPTVFRPGFLFPHPTGTRENELRGIKAAGPPNIPHTALGKEHPPDWRIDKFSDHPTLAPSPHLYQISVTCPGSETGSLPLLRLVGCHHVQCDGLEGMGWGQSCVQGCHAGAHWRVSCMLMHRGMPPCTGPVFGPGIDSAKRLPSSTVRQVGDAETVTSTPPKAFITFLSPKKWVTEFSATCAEGGENSADHPQGNLQDTGVLTYYQRATNGWLLSTNVLY
ncbi:hypothetical protein AAG570_005085 [Ranatra chinensis]|uniref:Uncharacterized protein n=1 Tax=Ranatra chinensis TaxID=642074 RepID=A0ABD0YC68_9HEMI